MSVKRPYRRTCRQFKDGSYMEGGKWFYLLHKNFARDPQHYIRAFLILQNDLFELFDYIEPADSNFPTYSHRIQQLLLRTCVEIEANLTAILVENGYSKAGDLNMTDYRLINRTHRLSSYKARLPIWAGQGGVRQPFLAWDGGQALTWYRAYNKSKHNRHESFRDASFQHLIDAMCGLVIVLSAQFCQEDYSPTNKSIGISGDYSYDTDDGMESAIGEYFRVMFPNDWPDEERYDFDWQDLKDIEDPFDRINYSKVIGDMPAGRA